MGGPGGPGMTMPSAKQQIGGVAPLSAKVMPGMPNGPLTPGMTNAKAGVPDFATKLAAMRGMTPPNSGVPPKLMPGMSMPGSSDGIGAPGSKFPAMPGMGGNMGGGKGGNMNSAMT